MIKADYSKFPFDDLDTDQIVMLMLESHKIGDSEFVEACRSQLKSRPDGKKYLPPEEEPR